MYSELPFTLIDITPPIVANAIPNQLVNVPNAFNFTVPGNTFVDQSGMPLSYSATLANGAPLPAWLSLTRAAAPSAAFRPPPMRGC